MDPILCCALGLCCPPFSAEQQETLKSQFALYFKGDKEKAEAVLFDFYDDFAKMTEKLAAAVRKAEKKDE